MQYVSIVFTIILIVVSYVGTIYQFWKNLLFALKHWNGHFLRFHVSRETGDITDWFSLTKSCDSQTINVLLSLSLTFSEGRKQKAFISFHLFLNIYLVGIELLLLFFSCKMSMINHLKKRNPTFIYLAIQFIFFS